MTIRPTLSIIGFGKVGATIAHRAFKSQHYKVVVGARDRVKATNTASVLGDDIDILDIDSAASIGDIVLLTLADDAIKAVCNELAQARSFKEESIVAHCSGALSSDVLISANKYCHAHIASMHPLQTFPSIASAIKRLPGSYCYYEGDSHTKTPLKQLIQELGMQAVEIDKDAKSLYHAAAVVACNYLSALMDTSLEIGEAAGIDRQTLWQSLEPLVKSTMENINAIGPQKALTGPIARGDINTIEQHLMSLNSLPSKKQAERLKRVYSAMGAQSVKLAKKEGSINETVETLLNKKLDQ